MDYPIVEMLTSDGLPLYGLMAEAKGSDTILINVHGTASNFYENYFMIPLIGALPKIGISVLSANNRGAAALQVYPLSGAAVEHFEDCVADIDGWIDFAKKKGYKKVILQGHSLGTEKAVYYMAKGRNRSLVCALILLGPAYSYGYNHHILGKEKMASLLDEARSLVLEGKGEQFLTSIWLSHGDVLPKAADSFLNFFDDDSEASRAIPLSEPRKMKFFRGIRVPILVVIGDKREYTVVSISEALKTMKDQNKNAECHQIRNCDHDFSEKEFKLALIVSNFIEKKLLRE